MTKGDFLRSENRPLFFGNHPKWWQKLGNILVFWVQLSGIWKSKVLETIGCFTTNKPRFIIIGSWHSLFQKPEFVCDIGQYLRGQTLTMCTLVLIFSPSCQFVIKYVISRYPPESPAVTSVLVLPVPVSRGWGSVSVASAAAVLLKLEHGWSQGCQKSWL